MNQPSEKAMENIYAFIGRVLPKYLVNEPNHQKREITISTRTVVKKKTIA